jgi:type III restriction enzyme
MKLKALAAFAKEYGGAFHRIEAMSKVDNAMRVLDMNREGVREAVLHRGDKAVDLYRSELGVGYQPGE